MNKKKLEQYNRQAKEKWGKTDAYREFEEKNAQRNPEAFDKVNEGLMTLFTEFGTMMDQEPGDTAVQAQVKKLQDYLTAHYYTCTKQILSGLGQMYRSEEFTENIDRAGGPGCAAFAADAIEIYCK